MAEFGVGAVGALIRQYRLIAELTQKQLAEKCDLNESTIRNYELGNRYPDEENLLKIAKALGVSYFSLADPNPYNVYGALHVLFDLERYYGLCPEIKDGKITFSFDEKPSWAVPNDPRLTEVLKNMVEGWVKTRKELADGAIDDFDYFLWESKYPIHIGPSTNPLDFYGEKQDSNNCSDRNQDMNISEYMDTTNGDKYFRENELLKSIFEPEKPEKRKRKPKKDNK